MREPDIEEYAKTLYYKHMELCPYEYDFMWRQCSIEYRQAWRFIAECEWEGMIDG
ncbi:hypothetical protein VP5_050 [Vibrio virus VPMCC5]|nr:hypothetical protein VP5_050 [Vibrio virus VPMCC5]